MLDEAGVIAKHGVRAAVDRGLARARRRYRRRHPGHRGLGQQERREGADEVARRSRRFPTIRAKWGVDVRGADRLAASLREARTDAMLYKKLATLRLDCPIPCSVDELEWRGPDQAALAALCVELGLRAPMRCASPRERHVDIAARRSRSSASSRRRDDALLDRRIRRRRRT